MVGGEGMASVSSGRDENGNDVGAANQQQFCGGEGPFGAGLAPLLRSRVAQVWNKVLLLLGAITESGGSVF